MGKVFVEKKTSTSNSSKGIAIPTTVIEKPIEIIKEIVREVEVIKEVKVPEYITVIKEEKIEVPVFHEVVKEVEKIVEVPKIQIVEKPIYITKEVYNIEKYLKEVNLHNYTKKLLNITTVLLVISLIANIVLI